MAASTKVSDMCRLCGTDTLNVVRHHIFEGEGQVKKSAQKISECLPLHIAAEDPLPKNICGECSYKLDLMSDFREKAVKTDVMLVSLVEGVKPEIPDDDDDGPDHEIDNDFRSDTPVEQPEQQTEPEVLIKEEEAQQPQQPEKRPGRKAANKRPIQESDMEEEEEEAPAKKRGRKPKEKETAPAASATTSASTNPPKENTGLRDPLKLYQCIFCQQMFATAESLPIHIEMQHPKNMQCELCAMRFRSSATLDLHMVLTHSSEPATTPRPKTACLPSGSGGSNTPSQKAQKPITTLAKTKDCGSEKSGVVVKHGTVTMNQSGMGKNVVISLNNSAEKDAKIVNSSAKEGENTIRFSVNREKDKVITIRLNNSVENSSASLRSEDKTVKICLKNKVDDCPIEEYDYTTDSETDETSSGTDEISSETEEKSSETEEKSSSETDESECHAEDDAAPREQNDGDDSCSESSEESEENEPIEGQKENESKNEFKCQYCYKVMHSKASLGRHERLHNVEKRLIECQLCGQPFLSKKSLANHQVFMHASKSVMPKPGPK
ncbi:zinc finger protein 107-like isoform X18 [Cloeon dipterum]|uniref:zinc finger protein 107-like isoform X18 n=1 Tax=Cloeon dipterum TaxID=197152 RepID=UPI00321F73D0